MLDRREMPSKTYAFDGSKCNFGYPRAVEPTPPRAMEPVPQFEPGTASTSGQKRSTIDDDMSSLRETVSNLSKVMNLMIEREAKRQHTG